MFHSGIIDSSIPHTGSHTFLQDLGQQADIDIYLDRHVGASGRYLSLHDEVKTFRYSTGCAILRLSLRARCWCCLCCYSGSRWIAAEIHSLMDEGRADR